MNGNFSNPEPVLLLKKKKKKGESLMKFLVVIMCIPADETNAKQLQDVLFKEEDYDSGRNTSGL